jgi:hypothetical protein
MTAAAPVRAVLPILCVLLLVAGAAGAVSRPADVAAPMSHAPGPADVAAPMSQAREPADSAVVSGARSDARAEPATAAVPDRRAESAYTALRVLGSHVRVASHPDALRSAMRAYFNFRAARPDRVRRPYLYYVDLGLDNRTARGYVFDMERLVLVDGPFHVAHGRGSLRGVRDGVPAHFSNVPGSFMSSLGLYVAGELYQFRGTSAGVAYSSIGLRLHGESGRFNDAAFRRGIVVHGAPYVTARRAGRSEGCPAMEQERARRLLPLLADGGVVFIFSPLDPYWRAADPWLNAD